MKTKQKAWSQGKSVHASPNQKSRVLGLGQAWNGWEGCGGLGVEGAGSTVPMRGAPHLCALQGRRCPHGHAHPRTAPAPAPAPSFT